MIPVPIHGSEFPGFRHRFRPSRGAHNALTVGIERRRVRWVVDADIGKFLHSVDRDWPIRFPGHRIGDTRLIRPITRWLNAGVMEGIDWTDTGRGVPQGAVASPVLASAYLHYVSGLWVNGTWRGRKAKGDMMAVRQSDGFVVGFQHRWEAVSFLNDLRERLAGSGLELHPGRTRLTGFGRFARVDRKERGQGRPQTFGFPE